MRYFSSCDAGRYTALLKSGSAKKELRVTDNTTDEMKLLSNSDSGTITIK